MKREQKNETRKRHMLVRLPSLDGGSWVDIFGLVILVRLIAVMFHFPALTPQESGLWIGTITSFAYSNTNGPKAS